MTEFNPGVLADLAQALQYEWLETDGLGGFAGSTIVGANTRRYHGLLVSATAPPVGRQVLVAKVEDRLQVNGTIYELGCNVYENALNPRGHLCQEQFRLDPWPVFTWSEAGIRLRKSIFMPHGRGFTVVRYDLLEAPQPAWLHARPLIAGRDMHHLVRSNGELHTAVSMGPAHFAMQPYDEPSRVTVSFPEGQFRPDGVWYYNFLYFREQQRGLDHIEDLYSPGEVVWMLRPRESVWLVLSPEPVTDFDGEALMAMERERRELGGTDFEASAVGFEHQGLAGFLGHEPTLQSDHPVGRYLNPGVLRLNPTVGRAMQPFGPRVAIEGAFFGFRRWKLGQRRDDLLRQEFELRLGVRRAPEFDVRQLEAIHGGHIPAIDLEAIHIEGRPVGQGKLPSLEAIFEGFVPARVQRGPRLAAIVRSQQAPVARIARGKIIGRSQGVPGDGFGGWPGVRAGERADRMRGQGMPFRHGGRGERDLRRVRDPQAPDHSLAPLIEGRFAQAADRDPPVQVPDQARGVGGQNPRLHPSRPVLQFHHDLPVLLRHKAHGSFGFHPQHLLGRSQRFPNPEMARLV